MIIIYVRVSNTVLMGFDFLENKMTKSSITYLIFTTFNIMVLFYILGMGLLEGRGTSGAVAEVKDKFLTVYLVTIFPFIFVLIYIFVSVLQVHVLYFDESLRYQ